VNGTLFFTARDGVHGSELWKSDGTADGTVLVKDINPTVPTLYHFLGFTNVDGTLFFYADDGEHGRELWKSDGTADGTLLVKDINPGGGGSCSFGCDYIELTNLNGTLFLNPDDGIHGEELWALNVSPSAAGITVTPTSGLVTSEGGDTDAFTVVLDSQPTADVTIDLSSSDTTEGTISKSSLTFNPTNWNSSQTVRITGVNDDSLDGDIPYSIITAPATSSDPSYSGLDAPDISVTNEDNDVAGIAVTPTSGLVTNEYGGTDTFTVVLTSKPSAEVTFGLSSSDTTEGTLSKSSLTFSPTNWDNPQEVEITGIDDSEDDGDIPYTIITAPATSSDPDYEGVNANDALVINIDDDGVGILVTPFSGLLTTEDGVTDSFSVVLNSQPSANVTIGLSSSDTTEGTLSKSSLTFTAANWNISQTVTIICVDDEEVDGDITYAIITAPASSTDSNYDGLDAVDISVTNLDDDQLVFRIFLPLLNDD
jgi:ELWxxDGT repeat protein